MIILPAGVGNLRPAGSISTAARYWRIYITANNGDAYTAIQEIEFHSTIGGGDETLTSSPYSQSSFYVDGGGSADARRAIDNLFVEPQYSYTSQTGVAPPHWLSFDLASEKSIVEVKIWPQNFAGGPARAPKDFKIQRSSGGLGAGEVWTDVAEFTGITGWAATVPKTFAL